MTRLRAIALALKVAAPHWHYQQEAALLLDQLEDRYHISAELLIADAEHESRWRAGVVNPISSTMGLLQIQPMNFPACRATGWIWSQQCQDASSALSDWQYNLRVGAAGFAAARDYCKANGYGTDPKTWLWLPTGWDSVSRSRCGHRNGKRLPTPKGIAWLIRRAASLRHVGR